MNSSQKLLSSILQTAQMGQVGIRSVESSAAAPDFKKAIQSQKKEYDTIEAKAYSLAQQRGWELQPLNPAAKIMADAMARSKLIHRRSDSKIAAMMVQGNTMGMIQSLQKIHRYRHNDTQLVALSQELLDYERRNIAQMESYL